MTKDWNPDDEMTALHDLADAVEQCYPEVPEPIADALRKLRDVQSRAGGMCVP